MAWIKKTFRCNFYRLTQYARRHRPSLNLQLGAICQQSLFHIYIGYGFRSGKSRNNYFGKRFYFSFFFRYRFQYVTVQKINFETFLNLKMSFYNKYDIRINRLSAKNSFLTNLKMFECKFF